MPEGREEAAEKPRMSATVDWSLPMLCQCGAVVCGWGDGGGGPSFSLLLAGALSFSSPLPFQCRQIPGPVSFDFGLWISNNVPPPPLLPPPFFLSVPPTGPKEITVGGEHSVGGRTRSLALQGKPKNSHTILLPGRLPQHRCPAGVWTERVFHRLYRRTERRKVKPWTGRPQESIRARGFRSRARRRRGCSRELRACLSF